MAAAIVPEIGIAIFLVGLEGIVPAVIAAEEDIPGFGKALIYTEGVLQQLRGVQ